LNVFLDSGISLEDQAGAQPHFFEKRKSNSENAYLLAFWGDARADFNSAVPV
jgi:hypothetical protein